ncbi:hypothetical protein DFH08DRAFT_932607 [Mycena albidolilacea]|uniref:Ricin B lectin domain-containing protein n=1 Tax=Mycena albidolilacea TaxID=1033008 RepID=A0AAD7ADZ4_9AGAR|nr:hypothetical protein DFH08DRAFT_932607 [Mycena albidolilacea]
MLASTHTLFFLATALLLTVVNATSAVAGQKTIFKLHASNNATLCLDELSDLTVTAHGCNISPELLAWTSSSGSSASTTPPLGTISHQYVSTPILPGSGTFCLAANSTAASAASVVNGTLVVLKACNATDVTQQWGIRESDGTIRLGNQNRKHESDMDAVPQAPEFGRDWLRHVLRAGSTSMAIYREDSTSINCLTAPFSGSLAAPVTLTACTFHDYTINAQQNFTFAAGSSSVGRGAPGPIINSVVNSGYCFDVLTRTTNGTSVDFLGTSSCNGSLTQQWQVNNDSTINLAGTNRSRSRTVSREMRTRTGLFCGSHRFSLETRILQYILHAPDDNAVITPLEPFNIPHLLTTENVHHFLHVTFETTCRGKALIPETVDCLTLGAKCQSLHPELWILARQALTGANYSHGRR